MRPLCLLSLFLPAFAAAQATVTLDPTAVRALDYVEQGSALCTRRTLSVFPDGTILRQSERCDAKTGLVASCDVRLGTSPDFRHLVTWLVGHPPIAKGRPPRTVPGTLTVTTTSTPPPVLVVSLSGSQRSYTLGPDSSADGQGESWVVETIFAGIASRATWSDEVSTDRCELGELAATKARKAAAAKTSRPR